jgi:hypothetical protein
MSTVVSARLSVRATPNEQALGDRGGTGGVANI